MDSAADSVKIRDPERVEGRQLDFVSHLLPTACDGQPWREPRAHTWREKVRGNGNGVIVNAATASLKKVAAAATSKEYTRQKAHAGRSSTPAAKRANRRACLLGPEQPTHASKMQAYCVSARARLQSSRTSCEQEGESFHLPHPPSFCWRETLHFTTAKLLGRSVCFRSRARHTPGVEASVCTHLLQQRLCTCAPAIRLKRTKYGDWRLAEPAFA